MGGYIYSSFDTIRGNPSQKWRIDFRLSKYGIGCTLLLIFLVGSSPLAETIEWETRTVEIPQPSRNAARLGDTYYFAYDWGVQVAHLDGNATRIVIRNIPCFLARGWILVHDSFLLVEVAGGMQVFDLTDPEDPRPVHILPLEHNGLMFQEGDRVYIRGKSEIGIYWLGNLPYIHLVERVRLEPGGSPLHCSSFRVSEGIVYAITFPAWLSVVDVRDPFRPVLLNRIEAAPAENWRYDLGFLNRTVFVTSIHQVDSSVQTSIKAFRIEPDGSLVPALDYPTEFPVERYVELGRWMLALDCMRQRAVLFDVAEAGIPVPAGSWLLNEPISHDFGIWGDWLDPFLFLFFSDTQVQIFDATALPEWHRLGVQEEQSAQFASEVYSDGRTVAVEGFMLEPFNHTWLYGLEADGGLSPGALMPGMVAFGIRDGILYAGDGTGVGDYQGGLPVHLFDVQDPAAPQSLGIVPGMHAMRMRLQGDWGIVQDEEVGVILYDIRDPRHPVEYCRWVLEGEFFLYDGWVDGNLLFVTDMDFREYGQSVWVIDISDPAHPVVAQQIDDRFGMDFFIPKCCAVYQSRYLIVAEVYSIDIIDLLDLQNPRLLFKIYGPPIGGIYGLEDIQVVGHRVFGAWRSAGIVVYDLDQPWDLMKPEEPVPYVGNLPTLYSANSLWVGDATICAVAQPHVFSANYQIFKDGDLDENGIVDAADLRLMMRYFADDPAVAPDPRLMDLNRDGVINSADLHELACRVGP